MITLTLLHPIQSIPVQSWSFEHESVIRIGRSTDNHVILYSAVVSRHHVEIRQSESGWEIVNLGANGTYLDGKRITQVPVEDGVIIRLARSGPNVQIHLGRKVGESVRNLSGEKTIAQRDLKKSLGLGPASEEQTEITQGTPPPAADPKNIAEPASPDSSFPASSALIDSVSRSVVVDPSMLSGWQPRECCEPHRASELVFCPECGQPLRVLYTLGDYCVIRELEQDELYVTCLVWRRGQSLTLRTLTAEWLGNPTATDIFQQEATQLRQSQHPLLPHFVDAFSVDHQPCLVMEPVYGQTLQQVVQAQGPIAAPQVISWMLQLCNLLAYLHQREFPIIHADLNPEKLIRRPSVLAQGELTMVGFSACQQLAIDLQPKLGYVAPERYHGQISPASDLYSLGTVLVYLLTGQSPQLFYQPSADGRRFHPELVPGLEAQFLPIIAQLTHPNPGDRYRTALDLSTDLQQLSPREVPSSGAFS